VYETVQASRLYEQIVDQILELVATGALKAGDKLPAERELAHQFGVSRTAVREAVKALRERGLVDIHPGRGTYIADISVSAPGIVRDSLALMVIRDSGTGVDDLHQLRCLLEPGIAALAAEEATDENLAELQKLIEEMDRRLNDREKFVEADLEFHLTLARATQNNLVSVLIMPVHGLLRDQRLRISETPGGPERGQYHHKRIFAAIRAKDPIAARAAMSAHLRQILEDNPLFSEQQTHFVF
jgi:GntR family transcriptional repressor for pyruvate dehydrogenase complex